MRADRADEVDGHAHTLGHKDQGPQERFWQRQRQRLMGLQARLRAFGHAGRGVLLLLRGEVHARVHAAATVLALGLAAWLHVGAWRWAAVIAAVALVWTAEAMNSAVERTVDLASPQWHALARDAKDLAAAAVLLASAGALALGLVALGTPLLLRLGG